ncbi:MAG: flagellar biosynthesis protein FlgF [Rhodospirillaceae bacterium]|nr:flagellar biosynthesis protein FlgF [Rhodospirillaceae bacterium]|tara:strand:- start:549 stop:1307 length:759 start_codon:yes stop_codon:yes gene_type:complete
MENSSYIGLSRQIALGRKMDIVSNNIANIDTAGYRGERPIFEEFVVKATNKREVSLVQDFGVWRNNEPGPLKKTGSPFDFTTSKDTYFTINTDQGIRYTNNGRFQLAADGTLVNLNGLPVLDNNDNPIIITEEDGNITVTDNGIINGEQGEIAQFKIVSFDDLQTLKKIGGGLYETDSNPIDLTGDNQNDLIVKIDFTVKQGFFEGSNVKGILEMTRMMEVVRSYVSTANMLKTDHDLQRKAVDKLGQVVSA